MLTTVWVIISVVFSTFTISTTSVITFYNGYCQYNPHPAKLLLVADLLSLVSTLSLIVVHRLVNKHNNHSKNSICKAEATAPFVSSLGGQGLVTLVQFSLPGILFFVSNQLSFLALRLFPLHTYALLCTLQVITTAACTHVLLLWQQQQQQQHHQTLTNQARWSLLLLLVAVCIGQAVNTSNRSSTLSSASSSAYTPAQHLWPHLQQQGQLNAWVPAVGIMLAVTVFSAGGSVYTQELLTRPPKHAAQAEPVLLQSARLSCWGVLLNGLWYLLQTSSSSSSSSNMGHHASSLTQLQPQAAYGNIGCPAAGFTPTGYAAAGFLDDVGLVHWAVVSMLAALGPITILVLKHQGSMFKAHIASLAMLCAACGSQVLQPQPPPLLFYAACCLAAAAVLQLLSNSNSTQQQHPCQQKHQQHHLPEWGCKKAPPCSHHPFLYSSHALRTIRLFVVGDTSSGTGVLGKGPHVPPAAAVVEHCAAATGWSPAAWWWLLETLDRLALAALLLPLLLLLAGIASSSSSSRSAYVLNQQQLSPEAAAGLLAAVNTTTDVPMPAAVVSMPCVDGTWLQRERFCPVFNCSLAPSCTVTDPNCCAHLNYHMLAYLDGLMRSLGMSQHYVIMYGSLLGAVRNRTILPHTNDVDVAMSAAAIAQLHQRSTKEALWRHGYVFWCSDNVWRLCAHHHHPAPAFKRLLQPGQQHTLSGGPYVDVYLMWPSAATEAVAVDAAVRALVSGGLNQQLKHDHSSNSMGHPTHEQLGAATAAAARPALFSARHQYQHQHQHRQHQQAPVQGSLQRDARGPPNRDRLSHSVRGSHSAGRTSVSHSTRSAWGWPQLWGLSSNSSSRAVWQLCFSRVDVRLSGRRAAAVSGLRLVVPDNAEELLEGTYGPRWRTPNLRPYAPSYDEDECVAAVLQLNATLFGTAR